MKPDTSHAQFDVLVVDDDQDDVLLTMHAFSKLSPNIHCDAVRNGLEALDYLHRRPPHLDAPRPHIILVDLNMPHMDGRQLLLEIKHDERLTTIPVILLSTSANEEEVRAAYSNHASAYMIKPINLKDFSLRIRRLADFWLSDTVVLPSQARRLVSSA
jgi:two-component system response regulator